MKKRSIALVSPLLFACLTAGAPPYTVLPGEDDRGTMQGFPPPADKIVDRVNQVQPQNLRWSLGHMRMILPTANIGRGTRPVSPLPKGAPLAIPAFVDADGSQIDFSQWMKRSHADALVVLHNGKILFEGYARGVDPDAPHTMQSMTKSFIAVAARMLIHDGHMDPNAPVARYVPELGQSAWADATVQQTLDMTTAVRYTEDLKDPASDVMRYYSVASGTFPPVPGYDGPRNIYAMLERLPKAGEHGSGFIYKSVNPEAIAWAVSRVSGQKPSHFISDRIWTRLGAEQDAYVTVDPAGTDMMGGGMSATARDLARFGEMIRLDGRFNGQQILPVDVARELFRGGDADKFRADPLRRAMVGYSYHDFWWKPPIPGVIQALGGFGQHIYINRVSGTVIVKFSSAAIGPDYDEEKRLDPLGFAAIEKAIARSSR